MLRVELDWAGNVQGLEDWAADLRLLFDNSGFLQHEDQGPNSLAGQEERGRDGMGWDGLSKARSRKGPLERVNL